MASTIRESRQPDLFPQSPLPMSDQCDAEFTSDIASGDNEANADLSSSLLSIGTKLKQYTKPP